MNLTGIATQKVNAIGKTVDRGQVPAEFHDPVCVDCVHAARAGLACKQIENSPSTTEIDDRIVGPYGSRNGSGISLHANLVVEHSSELIQGIIRLAHARSLASVLRNVPAIFAESACSKSHIEGNFAGSLCGISRRTITRDTSRAMASNSASRCLPPRR